MLIMMLLPVAVSAQTNCNEGAGPLVNEQPKGITTDAMIQKFTAQESFFKEAQTHYAFTQDVAVQTLAGNDVDGEFRRVSDISFKTGRRFEYVTFAPQSSLRRISLEKEDFEDIDGYSNFVLTSEHAPKYNFLYAGRQKVDDIDTYVFDVAPKQLEPGRRFFQGRIWVDDRDILIVKTCGKNVPDKPPVANEKKKKKKKKRGQIPEENITPTVVTYRELIDGKYWFPTYVRSDETLHFVYGDDIHVREVIRYTKYKRVDAVTPGNAVVEAKQP
ncbi:MAG: hypothetical protein DMG65_06805 [Candidatus Angelobacter sp. Gp1-AA117]|nr:MAG: hypothetical protein DMG65_06805 [Candidatus Angelobacter sp. Gp1-AA117]